jgi:hypothetical protein
MCINHHLAVGITAVMSLLKIAVPWWRCWAVQCIIIIILYTTVPLSLQVLYKTAFLLNFVALNTVNFEI